MILFADSFVKQIPPIYWLSWLYVALLPFAVPFFSKRFCELNISISSCLIVMAFLALFCALLLYFSTIFEKLLH
jgi:hypothetical protein